MPADRDTATRAVNAKTTVAVRPQPCRADGAAGVEARTSTSAGGAGRLGRDGPSLQVEPGRRRRARTTHRLPLRGRRQGGGRTFAGVHVVGGTRLGDRLAQSRLAGQDRGGTPGALRPGGEELVEQLPGGGPLGGVLGQRPRDQVAQRRGQPVRSGGWVRIRTAVAAAESPPNGVRPVPAYATTAPQAKTSAAGARAVPFRSRNAPAPCTRPCRPSDRCGCAGWSPRTRGRCRSRSP